MNPSTERELSQHSEAKLRSPINQSLIASAIIATLGIGGLLLWRFTGFKSTQTLVEKPSVASVKTISAISALGRLEPLGEVIRVSAPSFTEGSRIAVLLVQETDRVKAGDAIAILDRRDRLSAALKQAQQQVKVSQARLAQVQAGAKQGDIAAQRSQVERLSVELIDATAARKANVTRLEAELDNARLENRRYQTLYEEGAVSASMRDSKKLVMDTVQQQLNEAKEELDRTTGTLQKQIQQAQNSLDSIAEVRPTDIREAEAELNSAIAAEQRARADLETAYVRAPQDGEILKIHARAGETVDTQGIVEMGRTSQMDVVAEVYEDDLAKVRIGQKATIASVNNAFPSKLQGKVYRIVPLIGKKDVLNTDPAADVDARVAEVKIQLDPSDSRKVRDLTNLKVQVVLR
jgi:HlyD family secretion protein